MPDRRRTAFRQPLPERAAVLMRERSSSSSPSGSSGSSGSPNDDNPFAPPPEGRPDQPWQPRHPSGSPDGSSNGSANGDDRPEGGPSDDRPAWGSQWSSRQPGRQNGSFGGRPSGPGGTERPPAGPRWDPTDPIQRRARYALLSGMWAFFFAIFDFSEIALLLGALATYWAVSALRAKPKPPVPGAAAAPAGAESPQAEGTAPAPDTLAAQRGGRQQTTAAVSGLVTGVVALAIVATTFTVQMVYRDYYTCVNDALTKSGQLTCNDLLPKPLEPFFGVKR
ncbi:MULTISPECIES: hypothetical protein [unclassified Streptomyces]|uniref:hypothetical protein n=1 Tax=unclassified Streptomyces TaxID=2593676 RepID=UPI002E805FE9|nr:hypothetical protein [Streptomyces sp. NBC_00523]WUD01923.1 hypothetical protein OHS17_20795 [Streptomyces sp. NBC_00523]